MISRLQVSHMNARKSGSLLVNVLGDVKWEAQRSREELEGVRQSARPRHFHPEPTAGVAHSLKTTTVAVADLDNLADVKRSWSLVV